jgi:aminoglycoside phosphotransferase (APT) family kinase protein
MISADVAYPPAAEWLRKTMVPTLRRLPDAATWMALRAGAAIVADGPGLAERAARGVLPAQTVPRVCMHSPAGHAVSKAICFLFVDGEAEPRVVVKAMADPRFADRLRGETKVLETIADRVSHEPAVAAALPARPIATAELDGEFALVESVDPLAPATGRAGRSPSLVWLRAFHRASTTGTAIWVPAAASRAVATVRDAWLAAAPVSAEAMTNRAAVLLERLLGSELPRCAVHGDFWRGNIAVADGKLRVFDWEWARPDGMPLFDLWTYELAELRLQAARGERRLTPGLHAALAAVREELEFRGLDPSWALATLLPVLAEFTFRVRTCLGTPSSIEGPSMAVMAAAERLFDP